LVVPSGFASFSLLPGPASALGCDTFVNVGQFEIATAGTYYLLFRAGGASYGTFGIVLDNFSIKAVNE